MLIFIAIAYCLVTLFLIFTGALRSNEEESLMTVVIGIIWFIVIPAYILYSLLNLSGSL